MRDDLHISHTFIHPLICIHSHSLPSPPRPKATYLLHLHLRCPRRSRPTYDAKPIAPLPLPFPSLPSIQTSKAEKPCKSRRRSFLPSLSPSTPMLSPVYDTVCVVQWYNGSPSFPHREKGHHAQRLMAHEAFPLPFHATRRFRVFEAFHPIIIISIFHTTAITVAVHINTEH